MAKQFKMVPNTCTLHFGSPYLRNQTSCRPSRITIKKSRLHFSGNRLWIDNRNPFLGDYGLDRPLSLSLLVGNELLLLHAPPMDTGEGRGEATGFPLFLALLALGKRRDSTEYHACIHKHPHIILWGTPSLEELKMISVFQLIIGRPPGPGGFAIGTTFLGVSFDSTDL